MNLVKIATAAAVECERQRVGIRELGFLLEAYTYLLENPDVRINVTTLEILGYLVEPGKNRYGFRKVPVTFIGGGSSANASDIPRLLISWRGAVSRHPERDAENVNYLVKEFLWIHPFADANGRVGWLLQNYLSGTLDCPEPLKNHF